MSDRLHLDDLRWYSVHGVALAPNVIAMATECIRWRAMFGADVPLDTRISAFLVDLGKLRDVDRAQHDRLVESLLAYCRSACPEAESLAASERPVRP